MAKADEKDKPFKTGAAGPQKPPRPSVARRTRPLHPPPELPEEERPKAWERQPDERTKPWEAFVRYRDAGIHRTLSQLAREMYGTDEHSRRGPHRPKSMGRIMEWSKEYNWKARADAFDRFLDAQRVLKQVEDQRQMVDRHIALGGILQSKAAKKLREMSDADIAAMRPSDMLKFVVEGAKLERLSRGMPTENVRREGEVSADAAEEMRNEIRSSRELLMQRLDDIAKKKEGAPSVITQSGMEANAADLRSQLLGLHQPASPLES